MKKFIVCLFAACLFLAGAELLLYPTFSNWWNERYTSHTMADYAAAVEEMDPVDVEGILADARAYNEALADKKDPFTMSDEDEQEYYDTLDATGTGMMGSIDIPCIDVSLPIYHGTGDTVLQNAVGHMMGSSFPVGGDTSHVLLSGHRGLPSAKLFTSLDLMKKGDVFVLNVLGESFVYQVCDIYTVLPSDFEYLRMVEGEDLCTLITCTPYSVNTHRLLVRGCRVDVSDEAITFEEGEDYGQRIATIRVVECLIFVVMTVLGIVLLRMFLKRNETYADDYDEYEEDFDEDED